MSDQINHPSHYKQGRIEAIEVIEDVVSGAPEPIAGFLVGNALKYLLRAWYKGNAKQDLQSCISTVRLHGLTLKSPFWCLLLDRHHHELQGRNLQP